MTDTQTKSKAEIRETLIGMGIEPVSADLFLAYHKSRPEIWRNFEKAALYLLVNRDGDFGAKEVFEWLRRGNDELSRSVSDFKLNNNFTSLYGRVFVIFHPEFAARVPLRAARGPKRIAA
jgi:hypothetical protein